MRHQSDRRLCFSRRRLCFSITKSIFGHCVMLKHNLHVPRHVRLSIGVLLITVLAASLVCGPVPAGQRERVWKQPDASGDAGQRLPAVGRRSADAAAGCVAPVRLARRRAADRAGATDCRQLASRQPTAPRAKAPASLPTSAPEVILEGDVSGPVNDFIEANKDRIPPEQIDAGARSASLRSS